ncbi:hypothetical protein WJX81_006988 [Elliptochloris bilobata]|uniref:Pyrroline-5-carboxylate reductase n=1 Tax=Elliptochloris bilobata TaxID=381761 RepID=A0AAW1QJY8_9CHLO
MEAAAQQELAAQAQPSGLRERIGFVGAGQMGEALIRGFIQSGVSTAANLSASVRSEERQRAMQQLGIQVFGNALLGGAEALCEASDIIVLGVKPQYLDSILEALRPHLGARHLIISIAAGAASAYVLGNHATLEDGEKAYALFSSVGLAIPVEERMMDAVTGLSGSGPAYVFLAIEALADGAVAAGLPRDKALALAAQTVSGAARMVLEAAGDNSLTHPAVLKDKVTSPAGTTIVGLAELESAGVRGALIRAVKAAARRSEEMG